MSTWVNADPFTEMGKETGSGIDRGTRVGKGGVSRSHQVEASGVSWVGADLDLLPVVSLCHSQKSQLTLRPASAHLGPTDP